MESIQDWKCAVTTSILSVLIYLLMLNMLPKAIGGEVGKEMNDTEWYKSMEIILLVSVFLAYILNGYMFNSCHS